LFNFELHLVSLKGLEKKWWKLVWIHSKKDCACIGGKRGPNTILIKKYVQYV
jgi:hypothetical protein